MKAVIFDLDGVIVSTDELHYQAWKQIADQELIPFDRQINHRLRGVSRIQSLEILLEKASHPYTNTEKACLAERKNSIYQQLLQTLTPADILDGVVDTLDQLKQMGIRVAIGSSSKNAPLILEQIGLTSIFDVVSDGNNITHSKPNPEVFQKAAQMLGLPESECLVVEDAVAGIQAAKAAGMTAVGVGDAVGSSLADVSLDSIKLLCKWIFEKETEIEKTGRKRHD